MANYGAALRRARVKVGLSQRQLGDAVGIRRTHIAMLENGQIKEPRADLRQKIAAALGGEPEPITPIEATGPRADLLQAVASLTDAEATTVLAIIEALQRHGWGPSETEAATD